MIFNYSSFFLFLYQVYVFWLYFEHMAYALYERCIIQVAFCFGGYRFLFFMMRTRDSDKQRQRQHTLDDARRGDLRRFILRHCHDHRLRRVWYYRQYNVRIMRQITAAYNHPLRSNSLDSFPSLRSVCVTLFAGRPKRGALPPAHRIVDKLNIY